jgi:glutathione S-transferase
VDLYFSPLTGSLASRIAFYEAGAHVRFIEVDSETKCTADGMHFAELYQLGLVPLLRLDDVSLLSENAAILQYVADRFPDAKLAPNNSIERARLQQWLSFIGMGIASRPLLPAVRSKRSRRYEDTDTAKIGNASQVS